MPQPFEDKLGNRSSDDKTASSSARGAIGVVAQARVTLSTGARSELRSSFDRSTNVRSARLPVRLS